MVTVRSLYSFEQFELVLQKFAHEVAIDAVTNLKQGRIRITTKSSNEFEHVDTERYVFTFYASRIGFLRTIKRDEHFGFDIEEKEYQNSNHRTKISYFVPENGKYVEGRGYVKDPKQKEKERVKGEEINAFIEKLMQENGITSVARFNLKQMEA
jgi:hypothetical protein